MLALSSPRFRTALVGLATALLALGSQALPASAAEQRPKTFHFTIVSEDVTNFVPCPRGTPATIYLCGFGKDEPVTSAGTTGATPA